MFVPFCFFSTHAPARDATTKISKNRKIIVISTLAPTRDATDPYFDEYIAQNISTLVPARDATHKQDCKEPNQRFQPSCPHGTRHKFVYICYNYIIFQPSCPHGTRLISLAYMKTACYFNPRARTGRDSKQIQTFDSILSFFSKKPPKGSPFNAFLSEKAFGKRKNRPVSRCEPPRDFLFTAVSHYSCRNGQSTASQEAHLWTLQLSLSLVRPMTAVTDLVGVSIMLSVTVNPMRLGASSRESSSFW